MSAPNPRLRGRISWNAGLSTMLGSAKFGWLKTLKNCPSNRSFTCSLKRKRFCQVEVAPKEIAGHAGHYGRVLPNWQFCALSPP